MRVELCKYRIDVGSERERELFRSRVWNQRARCIVIAAKSARSAAWRDAKDETTKLGHWMQLCLWRRTRRSLFGTSYIQKISGLFLLPSTYSYVFITSPTNVTLESVFGECFGGLAVCYRQSCRFFPNGTLHCSI